MVNFLKALLFFIVVLFAFSLGVKYSYLFSKSDLTVLNESDIELDKANQPNQQVEQKIVIEDEPLEMEPLTDAEQNEIDTLNSSMPDFNNMNDEMGNELNFANPTPMNNGENYLDNMNNNSTNSVQQPTNNNVVQNVNTIPQEQATNNNAQQPTTVNQAQPQNANNNTQQPVANNQVQQQNINSNTQQQNVNTNNNVKAQ